MLTEGKIHLDINMKRPVLTNFTQLQRCNHRPADRKSPQPPRASVALLAVHNIHDRLHYVSPMAKTILCLLGFDSGYRPLRFWLAARAGRR